jgi:vancomycin permeability regulator SanA
MIRGFFRLLSRLLTIVALALVLTAVWIVYDGMNDSGSKADCAVVLGAAMLADGQPSPVLQERLDKAIEVYRAGRVPIIIVSGADHVEGDGYSEAPGMGRYLMAHGVPGPAILEDRGGINTDATAHDVAAEMRARGYKSVMIVTSYYHITRTKLAFWREGIHDTAQAHAGVVRKEDAFSIAREVIDLYYHLFKFYLAPAAQQAAVVARDEAQKLGGQIKSETQNVEKSGEDAAHKGAQP